MKLALLMVFSTALGLLGGWAEGSLATRIAGGPLEMLFGPLFRGPSRIDIASSANAWAGRTTLASGDATVVVSTTNVKSNSVILFSMEGNANIASGTAIRPTEVKTISDGGYFTLGTQDGAGIQRPTTFMWEIKLPGKTG